MTRKFSDYLIAVLTLGCTAVLVAAMAIALGAFDFRKPRRTIDIDFADVSGIKLHSQLRYAGTPAGRVIGIRPLTAEERTPAAGGGAPPAVRVTVAVDDAVPPIPADTVASIGADTLLGEKHIALSAGSPDASPLPPGTVLAGRPGFSIETVASNIGPIFDHAEHLLGDLRAQLSDLLPRLRQTVDAAQTTAATATTLLGRADKLLADNATPVAQRLSDLGLVLDKLSGVLVQSKQVVTNTDALVTDTRRALDQRFDEIAVVLQNLKVVTTHAKAITETLGERPSRVIWGFGKTPLTPEPEILRSEQPLPAKKRP